MIDYNVHSTLFFKYLRVTWRIYLLLILFIITHFLMFFILPGQRNSVTDIIWIAAQLLQITGSAFAFRSSKDFIKRAWFMVTVYGVVTLSAILIRTYSDIFLQVYTESALSSHLFDAGKVILAAAFILFGHSRESLFKIRRELNLIGLILITVLIISYLINYNPVSEPAAVKSVARATFAGVINFSPFIIGLGIYWMSIWKKDVKTKVVYLIILSSSFLSFILNNVYFTRKMISAGWITGGFVDLIGTAAILLIALAAFHELKFKEQFKKKSGYNLFYVSRIERIIPVISLISMLAVLYFSISKLDAVLIRSLILLLIPYCVFLLFFELYSYRSEDAILSVLSVSPTGIHITDREFKKTYFVNDSLTDMLRSTDIPPDFIIGNTISEGIKRKIIRKISEDKTLENLETVLARDDGSRFNAMCKIIPAKYYSYEVVISWIWDITDRKKYEGAILQQKYSAEIASQYKSEILNNLSNRMQSGYVTMKLDNSGWPDLVFTGMNKRILEIFNFENDLIGRHFKEIFPAPDNELIFQFLEILNTGVSLKRELTVKRISKIFTVLIFKASEDEVACLIDDITESKIKEKKLVERERELTILLGNLPGMVYRCRNDRDWTMYFVSQGSLELCGYKPEELVEGGIVRWNELIYPDDREKVWLEGQDLLKMKQSYYLDYRIITKDSTIKYVWEKGQGVFDENNELLFLEGFILDITKQKEAEAVLRSSESREKEVEKARALGMLAGGIAHDLNNKLMGIGSYTSLIDMKLDDQSLKKYTDGIQESIVKSTELIENLLIFARQIDIRTDIFSIHSMLRELTLKRPGEVNERFTLSAAFAAVEDNVKGDYRQIYKALSGVILNAKDAMPDGGIINISTENKTIDNELLSELSEGDAKKIFIVIKISDSGLGIEKEHLGRIFDPFYTTKPVGKGMGLGLSAVYGTIQSHKGAITVESNPGKGTSFYIYLPVIQD